MRRAEKKFYHKLYAVIILCAAIVGCLIYLTATGGMDKITEIARNKGKENNTTAAVTSSAAAEATASVSAAPSAAATVQPAQTPSSAPSSTPDTVSDDSLLRIVNHGQPLSPDYVPADLRTVNVNSLREEQLRSEAAASLEQMFAAAQADGVQLTLVSAYRSYEYEQGLYSYYTEQFGQAYADTIDDQPGYSEHQLGLAVDIDETGDEACTLDACFDSTSAYAWLDAHAAEYGWVARYPAGTQEETGIIYSPWAYRYVGVETAKAVKNSGKTLEGYFGGMQ
jgi:D-alanyl-D-alanine carboxypeptidase